MLHESLIEKIEFEISEIETEIKSYEALIDLCKVKEPDLIEKTAIAGVLHSFYTGLENVFVAIAKYFDRNVPSDKNWHNRLLNQMSIKTDIRDSILSKSNKTVLLDYLGFRHFFRYSYSFYLDWDLMIKLIIPIKDVWSDVCKELLAFVRWLKNKS